MLEEVLRQLFIKSFKSLYGQEPPVQQVNFQKTRPEFEGDMTIVVFPFVKLAGRNPEQLANEMGAEMIKESDMIAKFNVVKGFLNLLISDKFWMDFFKANHENRDFGRKPVSGKNVVVEYSSPNTNKPLHLGHIRNNLLGWSVSEIMKANGKNVVRVNLVNDRGIHICKSMLAWQKWGNGCTPESTGKKGDHLIGDFYVLFDKKFKEEVKALLPENFATLSEKEQEEAKAKAEAESPLMQEAREMLRKWEANDPEVRHLWEMMNQWVYDGFDVTYKRLGVAFEKIYYESQTYLLGKELVQEGLEKGVLYRREDNSVWCDLRDEGLDEKLLLRRDGTSVYMTQDLGTAQLRVKEYDPEKLIYVVGNEQIYHFDVLKRVLVRLGREWGNDIEHLSYGMVELPNGKMKSREGTVVDADDLMDEMVATAKGVSEELGKAKDLSPEEADKLYHTIGLGALKYFILKVDPKKTMLFNPEESIDFNGNTGPFVQYTHARICSVLRKAEEQGIKLESGVKVSDLQPKEKEIIVMMYGWPMVLNQAAENRSPAMVANFIFDLAKEFNQFYQECSILKEPDADRRMFRLQVCDMVAALLRNASELLGIGMPERM
ncbi:MAG: arginine--tRNA ligase [Bacteroidales bacterium]|nr:arginine--tRNA ligase [Bacteroidales bacterium]